MTTRISGFKLLGLSELLLFLLALLAFPEQGLAQSTVYVTNSGSNNVSAYTLDAASGALTPVPGSPFATGTTPIAVAVDPSGKFLYVVNGGSHNVSAYSIDPTSGALTPVPGSPFAPGTNPFALAVDPSGKFLYVTSLSFSSVPPSAHVSAYTINATSGALTTVPGSPFAAGSFPTGVGVDPSGKFVYVGNAGPNNISAYTINATSGVLTPVAGSPFAAGASPRGVAVDPSGKFLYVVNFFFGDVSAYTINATSGALTPVAGSPFAAGPHPFGVAVDPSGKFVYVANQVSNNVSAYTINATSGALTPVAGSPFAAGTNPLGVAVDPSGKFVYVANQVSNNVSAYSIDAATGALTPVASSPFAAGTNPFGVAVAPVCVPPPSGLVSWWPGDGNADDIIGPNDGTLMGNASFAAGRVDQAILLDGSGDFVDAGNDPSLHVSSGDFTVDAWVKFDSLFAGVTCLSEGCDMSIVDKMSPNGVNADGWRLIKQADNRFWFCFGGRDGNRCGDPSNTVFSTTTAATGIWFHVAAVKTSTDFSIYVNGVLQDTRALPTSPTFLDSNTTNLLIGGSNSTGGAPLAGQLDEVEIFNRALSPSEIQSIFNAGPKGKCPCTPPPSGMVAWWPGEGNVNDIVGGNNGSLQNGATFGPGEVGQAFSFDGIDDFVDAGNDPSLHVSSGDFTVDAWVKFDSLFAGVTCLSEGCDMSIVDKMSPDGVNVDGWRLIKQADNRFWFCFGGRDQNRCGDPSNTVFSATTAATGIWFHVAAVKTSTDFSIYVNGVLQDTRALPTSPTFLDSNSTNLLIGGSNSTGGAPLDGQLDEVEIFNRALSGGEIYEIYNAGGAGKCRPQDLTCSKTANSSFDRTFNWNLEKLVDKTKINGIGGSATFNYTVNASQTGAPADSNYMVSGVITVTNPNDFRGFTGVNVTDAIDNGGSCVVAGGGGVTIPVSGSLELPYACTYASAPSPFSGTNTATATWDASAHLTPHASAQGTAPYAFTDPANTFKQNVTVNDTFNSLTTTLGSLTGTTSPPFASQSFSYSHTVTVPLFGCTSYPNTALIVETGQSSSLTVRACGPVRTGALSIGSWQSKSGQGIITSGAATAGVCNSGTWLWTFAPFQNLSATASCSQVATYVTNVIKAANSSGASMNAMLKGQMLATALDVYFSDPSLGGNRIGAPAPIGGVSIDLTQVCSMIGSSSGSATCSGTFQNASSAFGGSTSMTVSQILAYAATQSNSGGSSWYGNVKSVQQLAKNTFNAINNQVAFAP